MNSESQWLFAAEVARMTHCEPGVRELCPRPQLRHPGDGARHGTLHFQTDRSRSSADSRAPGQCLKQVTWPHLTWTWVENYNPVMGQWESWRMGSGAITRVPLQITETYFLPCHHQLSYNAVSARVNNGATFSLGDEAGSLVGVGGGNDRTGITMVCGLPQGHII